MCRKHGLAGPAIWWKPTPVARRHPSIRNSEPIEIGTLLLSPEPLPDLKPSERFPSRGSRTRRRRAGRPGARGAGAFAEAGSAGSSVPGAGRGVPTCCRVGAAPSPSRAVGPPSIDVARRPRRAPAPRNEARSNAQTTHESAYRTLTRSTITRQGRGKQKQPYPLYLIAPTKPKSKSDAALEQRPNR